MSNVSLVFSCSISLATTRTTTKEEKNKKRDSSYSIARLACFYYSGKGNITTVLVSWNKREGKIGNKRRKKKRNTQHQSFDCEVKCKWPCFGMKSAAMKRGKSQQRRCAGRHLNIHVSSHQQVSRRRRLFSCWDVSLKTFLIFLFILLFLSLSLSSTIISPRLEHALEMMEDKTHQRMAIEQRSDWLLALRV